MKMKEAGQTVLKFGSGAVGLTAGALAMKTVNNVLPASFPDIAKKIGPGLAAMLAAYFLSAKVSNDKLKALAMGLGLAGFADLAKKLLGDKIKLISDNVPTLSGLPGYAAVANTNPGWDYYVKNSLQGLGNPYALNGDSFSMQGAPYALNGDSFSMQGLGAGAMSPANAYALN